MTEITQMENECCLHGKDLVKSTLTNFTDWNHMSKKAEEYKPRYLGVVFRCNKCNAFNTVTCYIDSL